MKPGPGDPGEFDEFAGLCLERPGLLSDADEYLSGLAAAAGVPAPPADCGVRGGLSFIARHVGEQNLGELLNSLEWERYTFDWRLAGDDSLRASEWESPAELVPDSLRAAMSAEAGLVVDVRPARLGTASRRLYEALLKESGNRWAEILDRHVRPVRLSERDLPAPAWTAVAR